MSHADPNGPPDQPYGSSGEPYRPTDEPYRAWDDPGATSPLSPVPGSPGPYQGQAGDSWGTPPPAPPPPPPPPSPPHGQGVYGRTGSAGGTPPPPEPPPGTPSGRPRGEAPGGAVPPPSAARPVAGRTLGRILGIAAPVLLLLGLLTPADGSVALVRLPLWSLFALACAVLVLAGVLTSGSADRPESGLRPGGVDLGLVGAVALAGFWVLLVLPGIASNVGFLLTAATAAACGAVWLTRSQPS